MKFIGTFLALLLLIFIIPPKSWGSSAYADDDDREAYNEVLEIAKQFFAQYNAMSGPGDDAIAQLGTISTRVAALMKFTGPISGLIATGLKIAFSAVSPEFKALQFLHANLFRKFEHQNARINRNVRRIEHNFLLLDYELKIRIPMSSLDRFVGLITDPDRNRSHWAPGFKAMCLYENPQSPLAMLDYMNKRININCQSQNASAIFFEAQQKIFSDCRALFEQFLANWPLSDGKLLAGNIGNLIALTLAKLEKLPIAEQQQTLVKIADVLKDKFYLSTTFGLSTALSNLFEEDEDEEKLCLLRLLYEANNQKRRPLERFATIVQLHLDRISLISTFCANITNNGQAPEIYRQSNETMRLVSSIGMNASTWMTAELENAWPNVIMEVAKGAVGIEDVPDPYKYNKTADDVWASVSRRGLKKFAYQVLITPNWDRSSQFWSSGCPSHWCVIMKNFRLLNIVLTRHPRDGAYLRADDAQRWFMGAEGNISAVIDNNDKVSDLGTLEKLIEAVTGGPMISSTPFNSAILLHKGAWSAKGTQIPVGLVLSRDLGTNGYAFIERLIEHTITNDERFKILFFI